METETSPRPGPWAPGEEPRHQGLLPPVPHLNLSSQRLSLEPALHWEGEWRWAEMGRDGRMEMGRDREDCGPCSELMSSALGPAQACGCLQTDTRSLLAQPGTVTALQLPDFLPRTQGQAALQGTVCTLQAQPTGQPWSPCGSSRTKVQGKGKGQEDKWWAWFELETGR